MEQDNNSDQSKVMTREELQKTLETLAAAVLNTPPSHMQSLILLDHLLRLPNAREIFDAELKEQARDIWLKIKSTGMQLNDPPLLFGDR